MALEALFDTRTGELVCHLTPPEDDQTIKR